MGQKNDRGNNTISFLSSGEIKDKKGTSFFSFDKEEISFLFQKDFKEKKEISLLSLKDISLVSPKDTEKEISLSSIKEEEKKVAAALARGCALLCYTLYLSCQMRSVVSRYGP